jgi:hypothetical protein
MAKNKHSLNPQSFMMDFEAAAATRVSTIFKFVKESDPHFVRVRFIATQSKNSNVVL